MSAEPDVQRVGGTVTREVYDRVNQALGLGLSGSKQELAQRIVESGGLRWTHDAMSHGRTGGGTVTAVGLELVLEATRRLIAQRRDTSTSQGRIASTTSSLDECTLIAEALAGGLPREIRGEEAVAQLREAGNRNWGQTEWLGWWVEHFGTEILFERFGGARGPRFGNTEFDYQLIRVFDLKAHASQSGPDVILNDLEACQAAVLQTGGLGFAIATADVTYDDDRHTFYRWHQAVRGKPFEERSPRSRRRKTFARFRHVDVVYFDGPHALQVALDGKILVRMAQGRQTSGAAREPKYRLRIPALSEALPEGMHLVQRRVAA